MGRGLKIMTDGQNNVDFNIVDALYHFKDTREDTVESALQVLIITLDQEVAMTDEEEGGHPDNLFLNYLSRIHREEDFAYILKG
jgi:hypothetical protein